MTDQKTGLQGNAPEPSAIALLLIDVINDFEFIDGEELFARTLPIAGNIARLKQRAKQAGVPVIYVNDNFGKWQSDFRKLLDHCLNDNVRGKPVVEQLKPEEDDYFVLKPKYSGFHSTTLTTLLNYLKVKRLILAGITADICVLFTANDAYMRDYELLVPADCVASVKAEENRQALEYMQRVLKADIRPSAEMGFDEAEADSAESKDQSSITAAI
jgi:nicotinamidase-related amidase